MPAILKSFRIARKLTEKALKARAAATPKLTITKNRPDVYKGTGASLYDFKIQQQSGKNLQGKLLYDKEGKFLGSEKPSLSVELIKPEKWTSGRVGDVYKEHKIVKGQMLDKKTLRHLLLKTKQHFPKINEVTGDRVTGATAGRDIPQTLKLPKLQTPEGAAKTTVKSQVPRTVKLKKKR